jgi:hypothetical protein
MNVIKQIVKAGEHGVQTIKMVVRSNERGAQGEQGEKGEAATITAGQAYSVPATAGPQVMNVGTSSDAVFDFYIPRGEVEWGDVAGDITSQADLKPYLDKADTALQPDDINYTVMQDLSVSANGSTSVLQLDADKVNLETGATTTKNIPLTVASHNNAGVMNSATFDAVVSNSAAINTILSGMVAINGLPVSPTQEELTAAWETATGRTTLVNRAQILDVDNSKYWTYYTNTGIWYPATADIEGSVSTFTNSTEGVIKGSTTVGQVYAESNGTGSVNGWDTLSAQVADNTANKLATAKLTANGGISRTTSGSGADTTVNLAIADGGVTTAKLTAGAVTAAKFAAKAVNSAILTANNLIPESDTPTGWKNTLGSTNGFYVTYYNVDGKFANQPSTYGVLETTLIGGNLYQRWTTAFDEILCRGGNTNGWDGSSSGTGAFTVIVDYPTMAKYTSGYVRTSYATTIPANADLNTNTYCQPGEYFADPDSVASTIVNSPISRSFRMKVINHHSAATSVSPVEGVWRYLIRELLTLDGTVYRQYVHNGGTATWTFDPWRRVVDTMQTGVITPDMLASNSVTTNKIADANVTAAKLASNSVTTAKIADASVTTDKLASSAVSAIKIADTAVTSAKLSSGAVTAVKLASSAVTAAKIANGAVTSAKIDWSTMGFAYKALTHKSWTPTSTAKTYPSGWDLSFSAVSGGIYEVECGSSLLGVLSGSTLTTETGLGIEVVSGATAKASLADDVLYCASGQKAKLILQATSTTVQVKAYVASSANKTVTLGDGLFTARRVA